MSKRTIGLVLLSACALADEPAPFRVERGVRQLFLDDVGIERVENLKRVVNPPRKHSGNPVIRPDQPWENVCSVYGTAMFDEEAGVFKLWYLTSPKDRGARPLDLGNGRVRAPHTTLAAYAFSRDGIHWAKPVLDQFPYDGDTRNNLLNVGVHNCEGISVLYDQHESDPARRWKCIYWDHGSGGFEMRDGKPYCKPGPDDGVCATCGPGSTGPDTYEANNTPTASNPIQPYASGTRTFEYDITLTNADEDWFQLNFPGPIGGFATLNAEVLCVSWGGAGCGATQPRVGLAAWYFDDCFPQQDDIDNGTSGLAFVTSSGQVATLGICGPQYFRVRAFPSTTPCAGEAANARVRITVTFP